MAFQSSPRKVRCQKVNIFSATLSESQMLAGLSQAVASDPRSDKELARDADTNPRTIQNIRGGLNLPSFKTLINLSRVSPPVRGLLLAWMDAEANHAPQAELLALQALRAAADLLHRRQRRLQEHA